MKTINILLIFLLFALMACSSSDTIEEEAEDISVELSQDDYDEEEDEEVIVDSEKDYGAMEGEELAEESIPANDKERSVALLDGLSTYNVRPNDTLMLVAFKVYGDYDKWKDIKAANPQLQGIHITEGQVINYPTPAREFVYNPQGNPYLIVRGDTLGRISGKVYGTQAKWDYIYQNNRQMIKDPDLIFAGFTLYYLPDNTSRGLADELMD